VISILKIEPPPNISHIVWEHAMKTVIAFIGTFSILFFGPLFLSASSRDQSYGKEGTTDWSINFLGYLIEHPEVQIGICAAVVLIYNGWIIFKNSKRNAVISIENLGSTLKFGLTNLYYRKVSFLEINIDAITLESHVKSLESDEWTELRFNNKKTGEIVGIIRPQHVLWTNKIKELNAALRMLDKLDIGCQIIKKPYGSIIGWFFRKKN